MRIAIIVGMLLIGCSANTETEEVAESKPQALCICDDSGPYTLCYFEGTKDPCCTCPEGYKCGESTGIGTGIPFQFCEGVDC